MSSSEAPSSSSEVVASSSEALASSSEAPAAAPATTTGKLPPAALIADVGVAAPGNSGDGRGYVGVWSVDAAGCAAIGTPGAGAFAVITTATFRDGPAALYGNWGPAAPK